MVVPRRQARVYGIGMSQRVIVARPAGCDASPVVDVLSRHGYLIREAYDGDGLIALADLWRPEAAVIELGLKGRPALAAGSALRNRFGGEIRLVGLTIPGEPALEKHALDAGFDHVVVDPGHVAEVLMALTEPGAELVRRGQGATFAFATTMIELAWQCLREVRRPRAPFARQRNAEVARRAFTLVHRALEGGMLDATHRVAVQRELDDAEQAFAKVLREQDGQDPP